MEEKRKFQRVHFDCFVEFESGEYRHICELVDISLRGALICNCTGALPDDGTACKIVLTLDEDNEVRIVMQGSIAHKIENRVGIHCESIDSESMTHLRKLVEHNLGDASLLDRDLEALLH